MLSRRNIRVKVMQILYSLNRDPEMTLADLQRRFQTNIDSSYELFLLNTLYLAQVAAYAEKDLEKRKSKHLPSEADKQFTAKLFNNDLLQSLINDSSISKSWERLKLIDRIDQDNLRVYYAEFAKKEEYKAYVSNPNTTDTDHRQMLLMLYKSLTANEMFNEVMDDYYWSWDDDKSLVVGTIKKTIKALPGNPTFFEPSQPEVEATTNYGRELLTSVVENDVELLGIIEPTLKNWDADRVAIMDMILIKMALSELTAFPTIPTKVTLNEFVEISKLYSTDKSKDFINGILDRLMKKLNKEGKIQKEGRGLKE